MIELIFVYSYLGGASCIYHSLLASYYRRCEFRSNFHQHKILMSDVMAYNSKAGIEDIKDMTNGSKCIF